MTIKLSYGQMHLLLSLHLGKKSHGLVPYLPTDCGLAQGLIGAGLFVWGKSDGTYREVILTEEGERMVASLAPSSYIDWRTG
jgi:hypothetical protein